MCFTYSECVFVAVGMQHAMRMRHVICSLSGSAFFFSHSLMYGTILEKKKVVEHKMCFHFLCNFCVEKKSLTVRRVERDVIKKCIFVFM